MCVALSLSAATRTECSACGAHSPYAAELALTGGAGSSYNSAVPSPQLSPRSQSRRSSQRLTPSVPSPQSGELFGDMQQQQQAASHQRNTGYAVGYSDRSQRRLSGDEAKEELEGGGGAELLDAVKSQENELAHQMAALQHYNKQKEMYRQQHGWSCDSCSFLNDPHATKCEICDTLKPGGQPVTAQSSSQSTLQPQSQPLPSQQAPFQQQRAPSLPASSPSPPIAMPVAKSIAQRASLLTSQSQPSSSLSQPRPSIPASLPIQPSSSSTTFLQQPSLPSSKPPASSSSPTSPHETTSLREQTPSMTRPASLNQLQQQQAQQPPSKSPLAISTPSVQPPSLSSNLPSSVPVQRAVSSGPMSPPAVIPAPLRDDWECGSCTYRNSWGDDKCLMCMAPKPLAAAVGNKEQQSAPTQSPAAVSSSSPNPQLPAAVSARGTGPSHVRHCTAHTRYRS